MALFSPLLIRPSLLKREIPLVVVTALLATVLALDGVLGRSDGVILLVGFLVVSGLLYRWARQEQTALALEAQEYAIQEELTGEPPQPIYRRLEVGRIAVGLAFLIGGANATVGGAVSLAHMWGVSDVIIGASLVAVGTSLPELATALIAVLHKETEIGIGNVVGSNIANILMILGITVLISPIEIPPAVVRFDFPWMVGFSVMLLLLALGQRMTRWKAVLLLSAYTGFLALLFFVR
jgi:cation:H+ antiporter